MTVTAAGATDSGASVVSFPSASTGCTVTVLLGSSTAVTRPRMVSCPVSTSTVSPTPIPVPVASVNAATAVVSRIFADAKAGVATWVTAISSPSVTCSRTGISSPRSHASNRVSQSTGLPASSTSSAVTAARSTD
jgi:hypothetical protein